MKSNEKMDIHGGKLVKIADVPRALKEHYSDEFPQPHDTDHGRMHYERLGTGIHIWSSFDSEIWVGEDNHVFVLFKKQEK